MLVTAILHDFNQVSDIKYLQTPFCKTATYQSSFFNRSIKLWNLICKLIQSSDFLNIIIYNDALANVFDPDKPCSWISPIIEKKNFKNQIKKVKKSAISGTPGPVCTLPFALILFLWSNFFLPVTNSPYLFRDSLTPIKL